MRDPQHPAVIGAAYEGGYYGGMVRILDAVFAVVWAPKAEGERLGRLHEDNADVPAASSVCDSMGNTVALAEAGSGLAQWARGLSIGGHTDWCLPARDVLELGYRNFKPTRRENYCTWRDGENPSSAPAGAIYTETSPAQTPVAAFVEGGAEAFTPTWYWSSTQYSASSAYGQYFYNGYQLNLDKSYEGRARAVRLIQLAV